MKAILQKVRYFLLESPQTMRNITIVILLGFFLGIFISYLIADIAEKKEAARHSFFRIQEINDETYDPAIWGLNFPYQYAAYLKTSDMVRTRYGGSEAILKKPTERDPRTVVSQSKLEEDPRLKILWAGYPFSLDFREERGHAYMLTDQLYTERQKVGQPGACANCHSSAYPVYKILGNGDIMAGFHKLNKMPYAEVKSYLKHPVACIDCHNPIDMSLRITRPAFMEGIKAYKATLGIKNYDVNKMASRREMRNYVCGQCHVEYYFKGSEKTLTYPWSEGVLAEEILRYYDNLNYKDWLHKETGAPVLKAQHPEFEVYLQSLHFRAGVTCVDCHMPYQKVGSVKITNHHVKSPYLDVQSSCATCHPLSEKELKNRIDIIQDRHNQMREIVFQAVIDLIQDIKEKQNTVPKEKLELARKWQRRAQFLFDFIEAENSMGFHAPQEAMRVLGLALEAARQGQIALR